MKPEELRIGNYVYWGIPTKKDVIHKIIGILPKNPQTTPISIGKWIEYKPIPLSEQWLIDFKGDYQYQDGIITIRVIGVFPDGKRHTRFMQFSIDEIKYVHRFQNIIYDLTGKELTK